MYDTVLFPTDGSPPAENALERAVDVADRYDAVLHALYVVDTAAYGNLDIEANAVVEGYEHEGERVLDEAVAKAEASSVRVETNLAYGTPHKEILRYANEHDVDIVVMGSHGRTGLERTLLGSVTERVTRLSDVPVLVVPTAE